MAHAPHRHHAVSALPAPSLLRASALQRLAIAGAILAVLWALVLATIG
ncbi:MAG TPA: hypothetical protein VEA41_23495 [Salinarimonas sp.]|jgi:hypothetical protein|nr:hypothetical protein [Salinarimonas sp.]